MQRTSLVPRCAVKPIIFMSLLSLPVLPLAGAVVPGGHRLAAGRDRSASAAKTARPRPAALQSGTALHGRAPGYRLVSPAFHVRPGAVASSNRAVSMPAPIRARSLTVPYVSNYLPAVSTSPYALPAPPLLARAAFLYDVSDGRVLYAWNARAGLPMASTTKIMTALLAITSGRLDDWVTPSLAATTIGGSSMYLRQGERLRLRDLLYGLLLPSGNDAAVAIAEYVGGSQQGFVAMMNRAASALGMTDTHFVNPDGLDAPGHVTSARDLAVLAMAAMQLPLFRQIVSTRYDVIPATRHNREHDLVNINQPLWWYPGTIGVKPGTTDAAGRCAAEWVVHGNRTLLLVVLGDVNLVTDMRDLLDWGFGNFTHWYSPLLAPAVFAPEYFGWDGPGLWVLLAGNGRYYARSGHTVRAPMLAPYLKTGGFARYGPPTSEEFESGGVWAQRFSGSWLFYNPRTQRLAPRAQEVE